jgi:hypothetical protein
VDQGQGEAGIIDNRVNTYVRTNADLRATTLAALVQLLCIIVPSIPKQLIQDKARQGDFNDGEKP